MNWEQLILRAIVPISFVAIWALTALFNRESQGFPARPPGQPPPLGPRPGNPTMRWAPPTTSQASATRRVPIGDDDILIIPSDPSRPARPAPTRTSQVGGLRRPARGRVAAPATPRVAEPAPARSKFGDVNRNVNQSLARTLDMTPLTTIAPMATASGSDLASAPSAPARSSAVLTVSTLMPLMKDPLRLRESFIVNELFQAPLALRARNGHRR